MSTVDELADLTSPDDLKSRTKTRFKIIEHKGFGLKLRIRSLNDREKSVFDSGSLDKNGEYSKEAARGQKRRLVVATVVDRDGNPYFNGEDDANLQQLDGAITTWIYLEARAFCNLDASVADAEKNSGPTGGNGSVTA